MGTRLSVLEALRSFSRRDMQALLSRRFGVSDPVKQFIVEEHGNWFVFHVKYQNKSHKFTLQIEDLIGELVAMGIHTEPPSVAWKEVKWVAISEDGRTLHGRRAITHAHT